MPHQKVAEGHDDAHVKVVRRREVPRFQRLELRRRVERLQAAALRESLDWHRFGLLAAVHGPVGRTHHLDVLHDGVFRLAAWGLFRLG
jgi:hypothetical protein